MTKSETRISTAVHYPEMENCWKRVGVWGKERPRCPVLEQMIHCRNCEVFTRAGRNLLERELPDEYRNEWTDLMAAKKDEDIPGTVSAVIFRIEEEWLAMRTQVFAEVIDPENIRAHSLPHRKNPILTGVINVHGEIQLCVSLKEMLGIEESSVERKDRKSSRRMIVINSDKGQWVFPADEIEGIHRVHPGAFQNVPVTVAKSQSTFTKGIFRWKNRNTAFLDDELLIYSLIRNVQ